MDVKLRLNWLGEEGKYIVIRHGIRIMAYYFKKRWQVVRKLR